MPANALGTTRFERTAALLTLVGVASPAMAPSADKPACRMTEDRAGGELGLALVANDTDGFTGKGGSLPRETDAVRA